MTPIEKLAPEDQANARELQSKIEAATATLDDYLRQMSDIYDAMLTIYEGEVVESQGSYDRLTTHHINWMGKRMLSPWLARLEATQTKQGLIKEDV